MFKLQISSKYDTDIKDFDQKFYDTTKEEEYISQNLENLIDQKQLLSLPISNLDRIFRKMKNDVNIEKITSFLFQCLDKYGRNASVLFSHVDFKKQKINVVKSLINEYKDVFDFNMINSTLFETNSEMMSEFARIKK